jgi:tRNA U55 pseudouridine synthase TruB
MASGTLLILIGDACTERTRYDGLDKIYDFEVLLGIGSDSGDILGLPHGGRSNQLREGAIQDTLENLVGSYCLPYPAFSSKTIDGRALHAYARAGEMPARPVREMIVRTISYHGMRTIKSANLVQEIIEKLSLLCVPENNDFRIDPIRRRWQEILAVPSSFAIVSARATVASGTYIRALAPFFAEQLGTSGLAYRIHRREILLPRGLTP